MILMTIRSHMIYNRQLGGPTIIAADTPNSWRRRVFEHYKIGRRAIPSDAPPTQDEIDVNMLLNVIAETRDALMAYFPVKVIRIDGAEGDDIIGRVARHAIDAGRPLHIISGDKDFRQLHRPDLFGNSIITQYSPTLKKPIVEDDPHGQLGMMILEGDSGDSVPGIVSPDDWFAQDKNDRGRKPVVTAKMKTEWLHYWSQTEKEDNPIESAPMKDFCRAVSDGVVWKKFHQDHRPSANEIYRRLYRNSTLVDLRSTPKELCEKIDDVLFKPQSGDVIAASRYLYEMGLTRLVDIATDFV